MPAWLLALLAGLGQFVGTAMAAFFKKPVKADAEVVQAMKDAAVNAPDSRAELEKRLRDGTA